MKYKEILSFARALRQNQTHAEKVFWFKVRKRKIKNKKFLLQHIIQHAEILGNKSFFIADFYCAEKRLIIEIDGKIHDNQQAYDKLREEILLELEYRVLRFKNEEILYEWPKVYNELIKHLSD